MSINTPDSGIAIDRDVLGLVLGHLLPHQEHELAEAIQAACDLEPIT